MQYFTLAQLAGVAMAAQSETRQRRSIAARFEEVVVANDLSHHGADNKALTQTDMGLLSDYGCWCFFENAHGKGRGKPVDEIDSFCKTLHDGYECIQFDAADAGIDCVPWEVPYNSAFGGGIPSGMTLAGLAAECDVQNTPDTCEAWTCKVEGWFVQSYFLYSTSGGLINSANRHANGFDQSVSCPISTGLVSERSCCGHYPIRFPYKTYNGARDCCQTHTFNTNLFQCCPDGSVKMTC